MTSHAKSRFVLRSSTRLYALVLTTLALMVAYVVGMAAVQSSSDRWTSFAELLVPRTLDVVLVGWLFYIGSSIGSFLNVVAWRMPRGVSINGRSHCPWCDSTLEWKENCPVFGWFALRGRCRTCRLPISPRYPLVEFCVGLCILLVAWMELFNSSINLPFQDERQGRASMLWTPYVTADNIYVSIYHAIAISVSWAFGLVRFDEHRLPRRLVATSMAMLMVPMLVYPTLVIVPWQVEMDPSWRAGGKHLDAAMRIVTGMAAAVVIGRSLARYLSPTADPKMNPLGKGTGRMLDLIAVLCVPGIIVGWQAVLGVTVVAVLIAYMLPKRIDSLGRLAIAMPIAVTVQLLCWKLLHEFDYWPSVGTEPLVTLAWAGAVLLLPIGLKQRSTSV